MSHEGGQAPSESTSRGAGTPSASHAQGRSPRSGAIANTRATRERLRALDRRQEGTLMVMEVGMQAFEAALPDGAGHRRVPEGDARRLNGFHAAKRRASGPS